MAVTPLELAKAAAVAADDKKATDLVLIDLSIEGRAQTGWVLMDYGAVVVHVFRPEAREYFRLENLWGDAPRVDLS